MPIVFYHPTACNNRALRRKTSLKNQETDDVKAKRRPASADERDDRHKQSKSKRRYPLCVTIPWLVFTGEQRDRNLWPGYPYSSIADAGSRPDGGCYAASARQVPQDRMEFSLHFRHDGRRIAPISVCPLTAPALRYERALPLKPPIAMSQPSWKAIAYSF